MRRDLKGFTEPGPIRWEITDYAVAFSGDRVARRIVARTPEHPATDCRFELVRQVSGIGPDVMAWHEVDATDPATQHRHGAGLSHAMGEVEHEIRGAWFEGGGGRRERRIAWQVQTIVHSADPAERDFIMRATLNGEALPWTLRRCGTDLWEIEHDDVSEGTYLFADLPLSIGAAEKRIEEWMTERPVLDVGRFYVYDVDGAPVWLRARSVHAAITECREGDRARLGQTVDIYDRNKAEPVAASVDVQG